MRLLLLRLPVFSLLLLSRAVSSGRDTEKVRNDKLIVWEDDLAAGEKLTMPNGKPALLLYLSGGTVDVVPKEGNLTKVEAKLGEVKFEPTGLREIRNTSSSPLRLLRVEFNNAGSPERWGRSGLSSHYQVLLENDFVRVYDIFIPATSNEPQHTHKNRVVVCLSGAELRHLFPDGRTEVSTLKTGEVVWRKGSTHIGQNQSANDFHAIAIEPK